MLSSNLGTISYYQEKCDSELCTLNLITTISLIEARGPCSMKIKTFIGITSCVLFAAKCEEIGKDFPEEQKRPGCVQSCMKGEQEEFGDHCYFWSSQCSFLQVFLLIFWSGCLVVSVINNNIRIIF